MREQPQALLAAVALSPSPPGPETLGWWNRPILCEPTEKATWGGLWGMEGEGHLSLPDGEAFYGPACGVGSPAGR
jgi:hypothetical protein